MIIFSREVLGFDSLTTCDTVHSLFNVQGIARRLVKAAIQEAAKKQERRYGDIKKIEKGVRRRFHDDITVIVIYLDHQKGSSNGRFNHNKFSCTSAPVDIFSLNADEAEDDSLHPVF